MLNYHVKSLVITENTVHISADIYSLKQSQNNITRFFYNPHPNPSSEKPLLSLRTIFSFLSLNRVEITGNLFLVATTFGDHSLHHLLPTVDHSKLKYVYPVFLETCKEFNIPFSFLSQWDMVCGKYLQLANNKPNDSPPGFKSKTS